MVSGNKNIDKICLMLQDNVQKNTSIRDVSSQPGTSATENNPANPERVASLRGDPISTLEK